MAEPSHAPQATSGHGEDFSPPSEDSLRAGHEVSDVSVRPILWFGGFLIILALAIHLGLAWMFSSFQQAEQKQQPTLSPLAGDGQAVPPAPRLEAIDAHPPSGVKLPRSAAETTIKEPSLADFKKLGLKERPGRWDSAAHPPSDANSGRTREGSR